MGCLIIAHPALPFSALRILLASPGRLKPVQGHRSTFSLLRSYGLTLRERDP